MDQFSMCLSVAPKLCLSHLCYVFVIYMQIYFFFLFLMANQFLIYKDEYLFEQQTTASEKLDVGDF